MNLAFNKNEDELKLLISEMVRRHAKIEKGGGEKRLQKQRNSGKLTARERIGFLVDKKKPCLEIGSFAGDEMYEEYGGCPAGGVIVVLAYIQGRQCIVVANDASVKAGAWFPITGKKNLRAQQIALENHTPIIYLVDSAGVFLPLQDEIFPDREHFGRIFRNNAIMSGMNIPQISAIMGSCVAGGAYLPIMSDESLIVKGSGSIFLAGHTLSGTENWDTYTMKLDFDGNLIWDRKVGNPRGFNPQYIHDEAWGIKATNDGGCVTIAGTGDEYAYSECNGNDCSDVWNAYLIKFDGQGNMDWQTTFSSLDVSNQNYDWAGEDIDLTDDGGAIIAVDNGRFGFLKISNVQNLLNGDLNNDNTLNVLDVVLMVNIILDDSTYLPDADLNLDGSINVLDVINLINLILDIMNNLFTLIYFNKSLLTRPYKWEIMCRH